MNKVIRTAILYHTLQAASVIGWWVMMLLFPETRDYFRLDADSFETLNAFLLGDIILVAPASISAALLLFCRSRFAIAALWIVAGAVSQATLYTFALVMQTDLGWLGVALMLPAMLLSVLFAAVLTIGDGMFRRSKTSGTGLVMFKTLTQIVVIWSVILVILPYLITLLEEQLGIEQLSFSYQRPIAAVLFVVLSSVGIWAAMVMSRKGRGTPLPLDHATEMVVDGPYAYVRNPMALSGIGQGMAVALFLGSPLVAVYALLGSAIWQFVFRPFEEEDLAERFGSGYELYRENVLCWIPRAAPYRIYGNEPSSNSAEVPSGRM